MNAKAKIAIAAALFAVLTDNTPASTRETKQCKGSWKVDGYPNLLKMRNCRYAFKIKQGRNVGWYISDYPNGPWTKMVPEDNPTSSNRAYPVNADTH